MNTLHKLILVTLVCGLAACGDDSPPPVTSGTAPEPGEAKVVDAAPVAVTKSRGIFLRYDVFEPNVEPYQTRVVITDEFMRIDDDNDPRNFVLMDRKQNLVYSVSDENDAILIVPHEQVTLERPFPIANSEQRIVENETPMIDGKPIVRYVFEANKQVCYDAVIAEGLLPDAAAAWTQYLRILSGQHALTIQNVPADVITACDLELYIFNPGMHMVHGLPINEVDPNTGYRRQLVEFEDDYEVDPARFVLPEGFGRITINEMRQGKPRGQPVGEQPGG